MINSVGPPRRDRTPVLRIVAMVALAVLAWGTVGIQQAAAHAELLESTPAAGSVVDRPPASVELIFNEPVRVVDGSVRLFTPDGAVTVLAASVRDTTVHVDLPPDPSEGAHTVTYRIVSADGHPVSGALTYGIGSLSGATDHAADHRTPAGTELLVVASSALQYLGLLLLVGLLVFDRLVRPPRIPVQRNGRLLWSVWLLAALGALLQVPADALRAVGAPPWRVFQPGQWGPTVHWTTVMSACWVVGAGALAVLLDRVGADRRRSRVAVLAAALLALAAPVWVGHTHTMVPRWLGVAADLGHLVAASVWSGGVLGLVLLLRRVRPAASPASGSVDAALLATAVVRFSAVALTSVLVLAASGTTMAVLVLPDWSALFHTGYGRSLLLKLGVVVALLALAGWNRFRLVPLVRARPTESRRWSRLRGVLRREVALLVTVVVITGVLSNGAPVADHASSGHHAVPADSEAEPGVLAAESQGLAVAGTVSPATVGSNTLLFTLSHHGTDVDGSEVGVRARLPEQDLGPIDAEPVRDDGRYRVELVLPVRGQWEIEVSARTSTYEQPIVIVPVTIG